MCVSFTFKLYFRRDGLPHNEIVLPTGRPFILLRVGGTCQSVFGMTVTDVHVRWDDDDFINTSYRSGSHPDDEGGDDDHLLHFCYYNV